MTDPPPSDESHHAMEAAASASARAIYTFRLYVTGATPQSNRAIVNTRKFCNEYLKDRHELQVVDLREHPEMASQDQIIADPTLIKIDPAPLRRFVGDMSDTKRILSGLGLSTIPASKPEEP